MPLSHEYQILLVKHAAKSFVCLDLLISGECNPFRVVVGLLGASLASFFLHIHSLLVNGLFFADLQLFHILTIFYLAALKAIVSNLEIFLFPAPDLWFLINFYYTCLQCSFVIMVYNMPRCRLTRSWALQIHVYLYYSPLKLFDYVPMISVSLLI